MPACSASRHVSQSSDAGQHPDGATLSSCAPRARCLTVRMLREELMLLQEPGSYVGEVVKVMGKSKVLVKARLVSTVPLSPSF